MSSKKPFTPGLACVLLSLPYLMYLIAKYKIDSRFEVLNFSGFEDVHPHMII